MDLASLPTLIAFKGWADQQTLSAIANINDPQYAEQKKIMIRLMNHIYVVDMIFRGNLLGIDHGYRALNTVETPTLATLSEAMHNANTWYQSQITQHWEPQRQVSFRFVEGGEGLMSAEQIIQHSLHHSSYHRGAVGWLIAQAGGEVPKDVLTVFLRDHANAPVLSLS